MCKLVVEIRYILSVAPTATQAGGQMGYCNTGRGADGVLQHRQGTDGGYCNTGRGQMGGTATQAGD